MELLFAETANSCTCDALMRYAVFVTSALVGYIAVTVAISWWLRRALSDHPSIKTRRPLFGEDE